MHKHGGMYADLDMEALRDLSPLLKGQTEPVFAALMDDPPRSFRHNIPNAWMASPAGHPFWQVCCTLHKIRCVVWSPCCHSMTSAYARHGMAFELDTRR